MDVYEADIKERWHDLTSWVVDEVRSRWWDRLRAAYTEPHRHYHNLRYLYRMLHLYDEYKDKLSNRYACAYALFFQNIVYDPKSKDNEAQSAILFKHFSKETTLDEASYIADLIEKPATHCTEAHTHTGNCGVDDLHYFLDFAMAVLGAAPDEYDEYRKLIRQEFTHLDDSAYKRERCKVLNSMVMFICQNSDIDSTVHFVFECSESHCAEVLRLFLQIPNIYATESFRQRFEEKARFNIQREIADLENI